MLREKEKNMATITISAVILVATNMGVWLAAQEGTMAPIGNSVLWAAFVALNVASILWAVVLLGLQPMVVALSYVAGGFLAYKGVQGLSTISAAEVTTAGATYGAFGALAVGNATTKVRLAFYNKKQVPFIFIIAGLLVLDAVLNSGISSAGGGVILNAVVFPFMLAGVFVGLIWAVLNHFGVGYNPRKAVELAATEAEAEAETAVETEAAAVEAPIRNDALTIEVPEHAEPEAIPDAISTTPVEPEMPHTPAVREARVPSAAAAAVDEDFFPLEIDKDEEFFLPAEAIDFSSVLDGDAEGEDEDAPFSMSSFDSGLYASGALDDHHGGVMVEEPLRSVSVDVDKAVAPAARTRPVVQEEKKPAPTVPEKKPEPQAKNASGDWLSGHLDLLNKLK